MSLTLYLVGVLLQSVAAVWALLEVRRAPRKLPWLLIALSSALIVIRRLGTLGQALRGDVPLTHAEVITLLVSILFLAGVVYMGRMFREVLALQAEARQADRVEAQLLASIRHGVVLQDAQAAITAANPAAERILGLSLDQMQGRTSMDPRWTSLDEAGQPLPGEAHPAMVALRTGQVVEDVVMGIFNPLQEQTRWLHVSAVPTLDTRTGRATQVCVAFVDITDLKRAQEALRETLETSQNLIEALPTGLFIYEIQPPDRLILRSANPEAERLTGIRMAEWVGREFDELWPEARRRGILDRYLEAYRTGELQEMEDLSYEDHRISGAYRIRAFVLPGGLLAVAFEDITARKLAQAQVLRQAEELSLFFRTSPDLLCVANTQATFLRVNEEWERVLGYGVQELEGRSFLDFVAPEDLPATREVVATLAEGREVRAFVNRYRAQDGSFRYLEWKAAAVGDTIYGAARDITERLEAEARQRDLTAQLHQAQKMESLGSLAGGVAHDLNNVLGAILSLASGHRVRVAPPDPLAGALDTIISACTRGRDVVRGLLLFSRKGLEEARPVDLNTLVRDLVQLLSRTTLQRVELDMALEEGLPSILGDGGALSHAVMNLCVNAVDAMAEGGRLRLVTGRLASGEVYLRVEDTGCGMPPEVLAKAAEPFYTTKPVGKGTGLGLALVYGTMKAHDGDLDLQSQVGQGTAVTLRFPPSRLEALPGDGEPPQGPVGEAAPSRQILLVDDDELILESVGPMLELLGHEVHTAQGGAEALARLREGLRVDLVILDMNMPGMTGAEVLPLLLEARPGQRVLIATGYSESRVQDLLAAFPSVKCISKPYTISEIGALIMEGDGAGGRP